MQINKKHIYNFKIKEIEDDTERGRDLPWLLTVRLNVIKIGIVSKLETQGNAFQISNDIPYKNRKDNLKTLMEA